METGYNGRIILLNLAIIVVHCQMPGGYIQKRKLRVTLVPGASA